MSAPLLYEHQPLTPCQTQLWEMGYSSWYRLDASLPNAFYSLLGVGLLYHYYMNYEVSDSLRKHFDENLPCLLQVDRQVQTTEKWCDLSFWNAVGTALISDINRKFSGKPVAPTFRAGKMLEKSNSSQYEALMNLCSAVLIWYEQGEDQVNVWKWSGNGRNAGVYVCGGEENGCYYLLVHKDFVAESVREGFPFFTKRGAEDYPLPARPQVPAQPLAREDSPNQALMLDFIRTINDKIGNIERKCDSLATRLDSLEQTLGNKLNTLLERLAPGSYE